MGRTLIVPLFGAAGLTGSVNLVRPDGAAAFRRRTADRAGARGEASVALARCEDSDAVPDDVGLTPRERELLRLLGQGLRNREIARRRRQPDAVHRR